MGTTLRSLLRKAGSWLVSRRMTKFSRYAATDTYRRNRRDVQRIAVQPGLELEVFWKNIPGAGCGPACSVLVAGEEILRLDCFGPGAGHLHADFLALTPNGEDRLFFPEDTVPAQIDRSLFEIRRNLPYYTIRSPWPAARSFQADPVRLAAALEHARAILLGFHVSGVAQA